MKNKILSLSLGLFCHVAFLIAVSLMAYSLFWGFTKPLLPFGGIPGRFLNFLLLIQFPIIHSYLLKNRRYITLSWLTDIHTAKDLQTTVFALIASLQLIAVFLFWTPPEHAWFTPSGITKAIWITSYAASWIFLLKAMFDSGLALQTGFLGWSAVIKGSKPSYPKLCVIGSHSYCRQPIYLAFALILLFAPVWSIDHLLALLIWGSYCFFGPRLKEERLLKYHGETYREYQNSVPYFIPNLQTLINFKKRN